MRIVVVGSNDDIRLITQTDYSLRRQALDLLTNPDGEARLAQGPDTETRRSVVGFHNLYLATERVAQLLTEPSHHNFKLPLHADESKIFPVEKVKLTNIGIHLSPFILMPNDGDPAGLVAKPAQADDPRSKAQTSHSARKRTVARSNTRVWEGLTAPTLCRLQQAPILQEIDDCSSLDACEALRIIGHHRCEAHSAENPAFAEFLTSNFFTRTAGGRIRLLPIGQRHLDGITRNLKPFDARSTGPAFLPPSWRGRKKR